MKNNSLTTYKIYKTGAVEIRNMEDLKKFINNRHYNKNLKMCITRIYRGKIGYYVSVFKKDASVSDARKILR